MVAAAWLRNVHRFSRQADAAHNALFVEDHLRFIELVPENPYVDTLRNAIVAGFKKGGAANIDSQGGLLEFHHAPRFTQLLLLAIAFNELETSPRLGLEWWRNVKNPFRTGLENSETIRKVASRLRRQYGNANQLLQQAHLESVGQYNSVIQQQVAAAEQRRLQGIQILQQQQALAQQREAIQQIQPPRMTMTNCRWAGASLNCTSF